MRLNLGRVRAGRRCDWGVVGHSRYHAAAWLESKKIDAKLNQFECWTVGGWSPVNVCVCLSGFVFPSSAELVKFCMNLAGPSAKPKYFLVTDSGLVP